MTIVRMLPPGCMGIITKKPENALRLFFVGQQKLRLIYA